MFSGIIRYVFLSLNLFILYFTLYLGMHDPSNFFFYFLFFLNFSVFSSSLFFKNKKLFLISLSTLILYPTVYSILRVHNYSFIEELFPFTYIISQAFLFSFLSFIVLLIFILPVYFLRKRIGNKDFIDRIISTVVLSTIFLVISIDLFVYSQYKFHLNSSMLALFFSSASSEIFDLPKSMYIMLIVFSVIMMIVMYFILKITDRYLKHITNKFSVISFIILIIASILSFNIIHGVARWMFIPSILNQVSVIPLSYPVSFNSWLRKRGFTPNSISDVVDKTKNGIKNSNFYYPKHQLEFDESLDKKNLPNIIFILVDALRADAFTEEVMPNSTKFFKDGINFRKHYSGGNATSTGIFSLFYSISSSYWITATNLGIRPIFMDTLSKLGYEFLIYSATSLQNPEFYRNVFLNIDNLRINNPHVEGEHRDYVVRQEFLNYIKNKDLKRPVFTFLFLDAPHSWYFPSDHKYNYTPPFHPTMNGMNYFILNNDTDRIPYINMYKNSVNYVDMLLKDVYLALESKGMLENSIIILSGDHGQEINDNHKNFWGHNSNFSKYQTQVPLVMKWNTYGLDNKLKNQKQIQSLSSHHDIVPTILTRVFGCKNKISDYSQGQDLFSSDHHPLIPITSYTQKSILDNDDNLLIFDNYGNFKVTTSTLEDVDFDKIPSSEIKEGLLIFSSFYNKEN